MTSSEKRFETLFVENYGDVMAYAARRCFSRQDAEDVVAETFAIAWRRLEEVPAGTRARLWLFATANMVRRNQERARHRQRSLAEKTRAAWPLQRDPDPDTGALQVEHIVAALKTLSEADRELLRLHAWEDLSADEIAIVLEVSTTAVWKRLQRARDRLSRALEARTVSLAPSPSSVATLRKEAQ
jgi:RNA polymerase sigma-70 factor (ECF subfamily)